MNGRSGMTYEWHCIIGITAVAAFSFSLCPAEVSAHAGWFSFLAGFVVLVFLVIFSGLRARKHRLVSREDAKELILDHRAFVTIMTACILVGAMGIMVATYKAGNRWGEPYLIIFFLCTVLCMLVAFVQARFFVTGVKDASIHRVAVYGFAFFYFVALVTGTTLVTERFPLRIPTLFPIG